MKNILSVLMLLISLSILCACSDSTIMGVINDSDYDQVEGYYGDADGGEDDADGIFIDGDDNIPGDNDSEADGDAYIEDPTYTVEPMELNFGCVMAGDIEIRTVRIENFGPEREIVVRYGLTSESMPHYYIVPEDELAENESITLLPGGKIDVDIGYLGSGFADMQAQLEININYSPDPFVVELKNENYGDPLIEVTPDDEIDFGMITEKHYTEIPFSIKNVMESADGCANLQVSNFRLEDPSQTFFQLPAAGLDADGQKLIPMNGTFEMSVACYSVEVGEYENALIFDTNDPDRPEVRIDLKCETTQEIIAITPGLVNFETTEVNATALKEVLVCNHGQLPMTFSGVEITNDVYGVFDIVDDNSYPLTLDPLPEGVNTSEADCFSLTVEFTPELAQTYTARLVGRGEDDLAIFELYMSGKGANPQICIEINGQSVEQVATNPYYVGTYYANQPEATLPEPARIIMRNCSTANDVELCALYLNDDVSSWKVGDYTPNNPDSGCITLDAGDEEDVFTMKAEGVENTIGVYDLAISYVFYIAGTDTDFDAIVRLQAATHECMPNYYQIDSGECNYYCEQESDVDPPDVDGVDSDCDGIDGTIYYSYFVAEDGLPTNPGTFDQPLDSIQDAIEKAAASNYRKNVLVATGDYYEQVELIQGVNLYGGYEEHAVGPTSPIGWKHDTGLKTRIFGYQVGVAARNINSTTNVSRFEIKALPKQVVDVSTYGMHIVNSTGLIVSDCIIRADNGLKGRNGESVGTDGADGGDGEPGGNGCESDSSPGRGECSMPTPGTGGISTCQSMGGDGGTPCKSSGIWCAGQGGYNAENSASPFGLGGAGLDGAAGEDGVAGYAVIKGQNGQGGSNEGSLIGNFWYPSSASKGWDGIDGGGGGGGAGGGAAGVDALGCEYYGGAGGGGGAGGCGGTGGDGGSGGGSSFGVFVKSCNPLFRNTDLIAGDGGLGGNGRRGGAGGNGGSGGIGGSGDPSAPDPSLAASFGGGSGGDGKAGGSGGNGGGGAGGSSFGVFRVDGADPYMIDCEITVGEPGAGGTGGDLNGNAGEDGIAAEDYIFEEE